MTDKGSLARDEEELLALRRETRRRELIKQGSGKPMSFIVDKEHGVNELVVNSPGLLEEIAGSDDEDYQGMVIYWLQQALPDSMRLNEEMENAALALIRGISPTNELESMLASQMLASHFCSLELARRTQSMGQSFDQLSRHSNMTNKFMRTFIAQFEALQKSRNGGKQTIQVQHINIEGGAQAVVGDVSTGGG